MTPRPDTDTSPTHDEMGVLIIDDEPEHDHVMIKALNDAFNYAEMVRTKNLPIEIKSYPCQ